MKIGIAQLSARAGDFSRTGERIIAYSEQAARQGAELLIFPLSTLAGICPVPYVDQEGLLIDLSDMLSSLVDRLACPCLLPLASLSAHEPVEEIFLIANGEVIPLRLTNLTRSMGGNVMAAMTDGVELLSSESSIPTFDMAGIKFALAMTDDKLDELVSLDYGVNAVIYFSSQTYAANDSDSVLAAGLPDNRYTQDARDMESWLIALGSLGSFDDAVCTGGSFVLAPDGQAVAIAPSCEEALLVAEIGLQPRDPEQDVPKPVPYDRSSFCWQALSLALKDFTAAQGMQDVVLTLDGTLSSAVLATLASDALGPMHVHALLATPLEGTPALRSGGRGGSLARPRSAAQRVLAMRQLAANLHINLHERNPRLVQASAVSLQDSAGIDERLAAIATERDVIVTEARQLARRLHALLLSSRDKTWLALEADGLSAAADLLPLGDLYRTDVLEMARTRNASSPVFPDLSLAPCDLPELLDSDTFDDVATDPEDQLRQLDLILSMYIEWERTPSDIQRSQGMSALIEAAVTAFHAHALARSNAGVVLRASTRSLADAHRPFGLSWHDRADRKELLPGSKDLSLLAQELAAAFEAGLQDVDANNPFVDALPDLLDGAQISVFDPQKQAEQNVDISFGSVDISKKPESSRQNIANLMDYMKGFGLVNPDNVDGHIVADAEGHMGFGGFAGNGFSPFSEN